MSAGLLDGRTNVFSYIQAIRKSYASLADTLAVDLSSHDLHDSELILNQLPACIFGSDLAEYLDIPWAIVSVIPLVRTSSQPMFGFPRQLSCMPGYNALTYRIGEQLVWAMFGKAINRWRTGVLGLPKRPSFGDFNRMFRSKVPVLNGFSSHVVQRPPDWGEQVHITGWWHPSDPGWKPNDHLRTFLEEGEKPVFLGFGSIPVGDPEQITSILVEAVQRVGVRAIIHAGWAGLGDDLPNEFLSIDYAPYDWLFERMAAVVHHGGSGTSGLAFRSGVPSLVVPFGFDQYYWGDRGAELGVSPELLSFKELNVDDLAARIHAAVTDKSMVEQAELLGKKLRAEDGVARAVEIINKIGEDAGT
jgi:UDP:flavonoid glycosyltransferase YjiC (YdhE family)